MSTTCNVPALKNLDRLHACAQYRYKKRRLWTVYWYIVIYLSWTDMIADGSCDGLCPRSVCTATVASPADAVGTLDRPHMLPGAQPPTHPRLARRIHMALCQVGSNHVTYINQMVTENDLSKCEANRKKFSLIDIMQIRLHVTVHKC